MKQTSQGTLARLRLGWQALSELGLLPLIFYARYQVGLRSGFYRRRTSQPVSARDPTPPYKPLFELPKIEDLRQVLGQASLDRLRKEADEIVAGQVRLFGSQPVSLQLCPVTQPAHWTAYELGREPYPEDQDFKLVWEPARFTWAYTLGRAYHLLGDERYPQAFWEYFETFQAANPPYQGPNWTSAQEAALRILAFVFSIHVFKTSPQSTHARVQQLRQAIADHAGRISPTLAYARAQNNNHLLSEAVGLFSAACLLPGHPQASQWRKLGWKWFNQGIQSQITAQGVYAQHSANYQRLVLQLSVWFAMLVRQEGQALPDLTRQRLAAATHWLLALTDRHSGKTPNLGPNDGAYIQPLTSLPFSDYRAVLQAAGRAFLGEPAPFPPGEWDEASLWYGYPAYPVEINSRAETPGLGEHPTEAGGETIPSEQHSTPALPEPAVLHNPASHSWVYLRAARFQSRPGHADQLHVDLWRRGVNLAIDAGTYRYTAPPPWDNALMSASVHNTVTLALLPRGKPPDSLPIPWQDQMRRVGRFLYLDWVQAQIREGERDPAGAWRRLVAVQDGYRRLGVQHQRCLTALPDGGWLVEDSLLPDPNRSSPRQKNPAQNSDIPGREPGPPMYAARLHWLLPDYLWQLAEERLLLQSEAGLVELTFQASAENSQVQPELTLLRAGERLAGNGEINPIDGWYSPTYGEKLPALSISCVIIGALPIRFTTLWHFPVE